MSAEEYMCSFYSLKIVKIAVIMDDLSWSSYSLEADMYRLKPGMAIRQLKKNLPRLLLVSASQDGGENRWFQEKKGYSSEVIKAVKWCKSKKIPTVFWYRGKTVLFSFCKDMALIFDYIFTRDLNSIEIFKSLTGKHNVFYLPDGVQPALFNPVGQYKRRDSFLIAGSDCLDGSECNTTIDDYIRDLQAYRDIDIYDCVLSKSDSVRHFSEKYSKYIKGDFLYTKAGKVCKGYEYAVNLNSPEVSQSCNSSVFELMACNTLIVSNYSIDIRTLFRDLVLMSCSGKDAVRRLRDLELNSQRCERIKLLALRKVFLESTCKDRLVYILQKTGVIRKKYDWEPKVIVWSRVYTGDEYNYVVKMFRNQTYRNKQLIIVSDFDLRTADDSDILLVKNVKDILNRPDSLYFACFSAKNFYDRNYLLDLMLATRYDNTGNYAKSAVFVYRNNNIERLGDAQLSYTLTDTFISDAALMHRYTFTSHLTEIDDAPYGSISISDRCLKVDSFNFCRNLSAKEVNYGCRTVFSDEDEFIDCGYSVREIQQIAENVQIPKSCDNVKKISADFIFWEIKLSPDFIFREIEEYLSNQKKSSSNIAFRKDGETLVIDYDLQQNEHRYLFLKKKFSVSELTDSRELCFYYKSRGNKTGLAYYFYNKGLKVSSKVCQSNKNISLMIPDNVTHVRFGIRIAGTGRTVIENIYLEKYHDYFKVQARVFNKKTVVVVHHYPSYDDIYRYGFVHSRVRGYISRKEKILVFVLDKDRSDTVFSEYEGVDIITGDNSVLEMILNDGVDNVLVHFLTPAIWQSLKKLPERIRLYVWCHGSDVLLYDRRSYNYVTDEEKKKGHDISDAIKDFWMPILSNLPANMHLVFVSRFLADVVMHDFGVQIPEKRYSIIHNPIDISIFKYSPKKPDDRYRILSIRSFATRMYANDQTVEAINQLALRSDFAKFEILLIGDGRLFDETVALLKDYPNVHVRRCFLNHYEIAELHAQYGVFLCPSRYDTQGVSRDEARASGLVPVTTSIAAIPEFVNNETAMLAEPENPKSIADAIGMLADNPDMFVSMSRRTSEDVALRLSMDKIIEQELGLFRKR